MKRAVTPYGLPVIDSCFTCVLHEDGLFCRLPTEALRDLDTLRQPAYYPAGALLYVQGEAPRGLFILCSGEARLLAGSTEGKNITLRVVQKGEVMGLSCAVANTPYQSTAETLAPSQVSFIAREPFMRFLHQHTEAAFRVAEHLSRELHKAWEQARLLSLAPNARSKLAQLLLLWAAQHGQSTPEGVRVPLHMTREAIGEAIGSSRETVSRLFADLQRRKLVRVHGGAVLLPHPEQLRALSRG